MCFLLLYLEREEWQMQCHSGLTRDPLNPDGIVSPQWGCEFLQTVAVVGFYLVPSDLQVALCHEEKRFHHVHKFHSVENQQQDMLADPSYPRAAIQGTVCPSSPRPLQKGTLWNTSGTDTHSEFGHSITSLNKLYLGQFHIIKCTILSIPFNEFGQMYTGT